MPTRCLACLLVIATTFAGCVTVHVTEPVTTQSPVPVRIGTFDRTPVLVAFYESETHATKMEALRSRRDEAVAAGDDALASALEAEGAAAQDLAHRQLAGQALLTNVLDALAPAWSRIFEEAGITAIVESPGQVASNVELVDVTDLLVEALPPPST